MTGCIDNIRLYLYLLFFSFWYRYAIICWAFTVE